MQEVKIPIGGLNTDDAPDYLNQTEYSESHNYRSSGTDGEDNRHGTNIEGNSLIDFTLPAGLSANIGNAVFKSIRKAYGVIYSSTGKHNILEFDYDTLTLIRLFEDLTDTGGVQIFNILPSHYFNDIKLFHEKYLTMTDGISGMIYCINIERLKNGGYPNPIIAEDFNLLKAQGLKPILLQYISDGDKTSNLIKGELFQFRYQNEYLDKMSSSWSTISKRAVPEFESTDEIGDDPRKLNGIQLSINIGTDRVQKLNIAARSQLNSWFIVKSISRDYILTLPTEIDIEQEIREAYNPLTNEYSFIFYNDGAYEPIPVLDTDEPYDAIPINAGTIEVINGDILALADLTEGYERPEDPNVQLSVSTYEVDLGGSIDNPRNFPQPGVNNVRISGSHRRYSEINFNGTPKEGDQLTITIDQLDGRPSTPQVITYTATSEDDEDLDRFTTNLLNYLPNDTIVGGGTFYFKKRVVYNPNSISVFFVTRSYFETKSANLVLEQDTEVSGITLNTVKTNTSYQLALLHFDKYGRYFPITTGDNYIVNTPSYAISEGKIPQIGWFIDGTPPEEAISYQWAVSENTKYQKTLYVTGLYDAEESSEDFIFFNLFSLDAYMENSPSGIVSYDFSQGDRVSLLYSFDDTGEIEKWFNNPSIDFPVAGFEIKAGDTDADPPKYLLKVKKSDIITLSDIENTEVMLEVYTPKRNTEDINAKIFYEIGEQFDIINGEYSVNSGTIKSLDVYLHPRKFRSNEEGSNAVFAFPVEDFNFSDEYVSNYWSAGRGRTYNDEVGRVRRKAQIRYSEPTSIGELSNNINRFYATRIYGDQPGQTTSIYGAITKLIMRDMYLIALQELKVAHIPVNHSIITDTLEQEQLAISNTLLNNVRYLGGNIGTGLAKRAIVMSNVGNVYFVDHNNGYPCRDGYDGLRIINDKNTKYFRDRIKQTDPNEIVLIFDDFHNELNLVFIDINGEIQVIRFDTQEWEYRDDYDLSIGEVTISNPPNGTATIQGENILYVPDNGYVGSDNVEISFNNGSGVVTKRACITIVAGTTTVDEFSFTPLYNQPVSTLVVSNSIFVSGNNVAVPISIVNGEYRVNNTVWTSVAGIVNFGDKVEVRHTTSDTLGVTTTTTLTISDKSANFISQTAGNPNPFLFTQQNNVTQNTLINSNIVTLGGIAGSLSISVSGGEYRVNGASWTNIPSTVTTGDTLQLRVLSSNTAETESSVTVNVGSYTTDFTVITESGYYVAIDGYSSVDGSGNASCALSIDSELRFYTINPSGVVETGDQLYVFSEPDYIPASFSSIKSISYMEFSQRVWIVVGADGVITNKGFCDSSSVYTLTPSEEDNGMGFTEVIFTLRDQEGNPVTLSTPFTFNWTVNKVTIVGGVPSPDSSGTPSIFNAGSPSERVTDFDNTVYMYTGASAYDITPNEIDGNLIV